LIRAVLPFLEDAKTVAAGGIIRVANGAKIREGRVEGVGLPSSIWAQFQILEYLRSFLAGRLGWELVGMTFFVSGGWGLFRRAAVLEVGGVPTDSMAEDMDLSLALHTKHIEEGRPYRITFIPEVVCWTEVPSDMTTLMNQRDRWQRGIIKSLGPYRRVLFNPKYGKLGYGSFPFYYLLEMPAPAIELCGMITLVALLLAGRVSNLHLAAYLTLTVLWSTAISIAGLTLSQLNRHNFQRPLDLVHLIILSFFEHLIYKPIRLIAQWRGMLGLFRGKRAWGKMKRAGFQDRLEKDEPAPDREGDADERSEAWSMTTQSSMSIESISVDVLRRYAAKAKAERAAAEKAESEGAKTEEGPENSGAKDGADESPARKGAGE
jgi:cellulose synthase/poly-beta-1,6-N-acetylglucosamine synthase-like glycosyltransferase